MIGENLFGDTNTGPIVICPKDTGDNLALWAKNNQPLLIQSLAISGALLFRNYKINGARHFEHNAGSLSDAPLLKYSIVPLRVPTSGVIFIPLRNISVIK